jgi:cysteinyl-tRNA synthetase
MKNLIISNYSWHFHHHRVKLAKQTHGTQIFYPTADFANNKKNKAGKRHKQDFLLWRDPKPSDPSYL